MRRALAMSFPVLLALILGVLAAPMAASAKPGMSVGIEQFGNMDNPALRPLLLDTQKDLGAQVIRYTLRWDWVAKCDATTQGGAPAHSMANSCYDWSIPDAVVRDAHARGPRVLLSIYGTPKWKFNRSENWVGQSDAEFNSLVPAFAAFAQAGATRYSGASGLPRVGEWTIWNEPNGPFFEPRFAGNTLIGPARYARLYDAAARGIKAADPSHRVAIGPTAPHANKVPPITFAKQVLPILQQLGSPVDAWGHNGYMGSQSPLKHTVKSPFVGLGNVHDLTNLMDQYPVTANKPIWITEFGYQTNGSQKAVSEEQQALLASDAFVYAWTQPRIEMFIWYSLHDDRETATAAGFHAGLFRPIQQLCGGALCPKPVAGVFRHTLWISARSGGQVTLWGQARNQPANTRVYVKVPNDGWRAYSNPETAANGTVSIRIAAPPGTQAMTCDLRCGPVRTLGQAEAEVGGGGGGGGGEVVVKKSKVTKLSKVTLAKRASTRNGIVFMVPTCGRGCTVYARIHARGATSGISRARSPKTRTVVIGKSRVRTEAGSKRVLLRFNVSARRELARKRTATVTLRTFIRYADGRRVISDRPVLLK